MYRFYSVGRFCCILLYFALSFSIFVIININSLFRIPFPKNRSYEINANTVTNPVQINRIERRFNKHINRHTAIEKSKLSLMCWCCGAIECASIVFNAICNAFFRCLISCSDCLSLFFFCHEVNRRVL